VNDDDQLETITGSQIMCIEPNKNGWKIAGKNGNIQIHADAQIEPTAIIGSYTSVSWGGYIGKHTVIKDHVTIEPKVIIHDHCCVSWGVKICEEAKIDARVLIKHRAIIGAGARIREDARIGVQAVVCAGRAVGVYGRVQPYEVVQMGPDLVGLKTLDDVLYDRWWNF
jgi:UDP-3-O-[3-hydroxymyristoyl] glucosamine N-acyltransferase